jgi:hypothetical protein
VTAGPSGWLVFVSHSGGDAWVAKQIAREIAACGATAFLAETDVDVGADFEEDILAALERANEVLILVTPSALERPYIWMETGAAWIRRLTIVGLLLGLTAEELQSQPFVPILLKRRAVLPLNDIEVYFRQLRRRVRAADRTDPESSS